MNAIILSIGDELVLGQTVDTNSAWISHQLSAVGLRTAAHVTVSDDQAAIEQAIRAAAAQCDALIISGGLGPTADDLTRQAIAAVLGVELEVHAQAMERLVAYFDKIKRPMVESNKIQAMIPRGAAMIENTCGTAPGIEVLYGSCRLFAMPGVPREMKVMFERDILPHLAKDGGGAAIVSRTLHTFGIGESNLGEMLGDLMRRGRNPSVGTTVSNGIVSVRVNSYFESRNEAQAALEKTVAACHAALGDLIFGQEDQTVASVVADMLRRANVLIVAAESGTDGVLARMLSDVPMSGQYFEQGWIVSSDQAKTSLLHVPAELIKEHGSVSLSVVGAMAAGARRLGASDIALALSGVVDSTCAGEACPVGTFAIALAHANGVTSRTFRFSGERDLIRDRAAKMALTLLRFHLMGKAVPF